MSDESGEKEFFEEKSDGGASKETRTWAMWLHLSMLSGFIVPFAGLVVPIVLWQIKKEELPGIDPHGKNAVNWLISYVIYAAVAFALVFLFIGFILLPIIGIIGIVFPIIAGIKANEGKIWTYPLSIKFIS